MKRTFCLAGLLAICLPGAAQNYTEPSLSPDGSLLVFILDTSGNQDIFVARSDGSGARRIVDMKGYNVHPRWSPDGRKILFNCFPFTAEAPHDVYIVDADGANLTNLTAGKLHDGQANDWSPDGTRVLVSSGAYPAINLFSINTDGSQLRQLTFEKNMVCYYASWSPDGQKILFTGFSDPHRDLYVMDSAGARRVKLYEACDAPAWSPDGKKIAFQVRRDDTFYLLWMNADGSGAAPLQGTAFEGETASWSANGQVLYFERKSAAGLFEIWKLDLPTGVTTRVLPLLKEE